jgi:hypothetical protein
MPLTKRSSFLDSAHMTGNIDGIYTFRRAILGVLSAGTARKSPGFGREIYRIPAECCSRNAAREEGSFAAPTQSGPWHASEDASWLRRTPRM